MKLAECIWLRMISAGIDFPLLFATGLVTELVTGLATGDGGFVDSDLDVAKEGSCSPSSIEKIPRLLKVCEK